MVIFYFISEKIWDLVKDFVPLTLSASGELHVDPKVTENLAATFVKIQEFNTKVQRLEAAIKGLFVPVPYSGAGSPLMFLQQNLTDSFVCTWKRGS